MDLSGYYQMDGKDLWAAYNLFVESGSDDFLKYPARKESITHDWQDSNGIDIDTSRVYVGPRDVTLRCAIIVDSEDMFWQKYTGLIADLTQPGQRRISKAEFGSRSFYCIYKDCGSFDRFTRLRDVDKVACKFTLVLTEPNPQLPNDNIFIVDEEGRFLTT